MEKEKLISFCPVSLKNLRVPEGESFSLHIIDGKFNLSREDWEKYKPKDKDISIVKDKDISLKEGKYIKKNLGSFTISFKLVKGFSFLPHQPNVIEWMMERSKENFRGIVGGILGLEMSLGKTLIYLYFCLLKREEKKKIKKTLEKIVSSFKFFKSPVKTKKLTNIYEKIVSFLLSPDRPNLVIVPKTAINTWTEQIEKFFDKKEVRYSILHKDYMKKEDLSDNFFKENIFILTTYETIEKEATKEKIYESNWIKDQYGKIKGIDPPKWDRSLEKICKKKKGFTKIFFTLFDSICLDESHKISNPKSQTCWGVMSLYGKVKWCMSGTPMKNGFKDLFAQYNFLGYKEIDSISRFTLDNYERRSLSNSVYFLTKKEANLEIKSSKVQEIEIKLSAEERLVYDKFLSFSRREIEGEVSRNSILTIVLRLRQICCAPFTLLSLKTVEEEKRAIDNLPETLQKWISDKDGEAGRKSTKNLEIKKLIKKILLTTDDKIVVFSGFVRFLRLIEENLKEEGILYSMITGKVNGKNRKEELRKFKTDPNIRILIMTTSTGSVSLNLEFANHMILADEDWCPATNKQAAARIERVGQKKETFVYRFLVKDSIEERVRSLNLQKEKEIENIMEKKKISIEELKKLIK